MLLACPFVNDAESLWRVEIFGDRPRQFRDGVLRKSVLGELFVETYYTVGPAFATVVDHSDPLRAAARDGLGPLVRLVRGMKY